MIQRSDIYMVMLLMLLIAGVSADTVHRVNSLPQDSLLNPEEGTNVQTGEEVTSTNESPSLSYNLSGVYTVSGETVNRSQVMITSDTTDVSAVYVTNGGNLTLNNPVIRTSGNTSSQDASSFYGLNGAVLANNGSIVTMNGGSISTTGSGANGAIPTGTGTSITMNGVKINATGSGGHGVMATLGATLLLQDVDITTSGQNSAPIATDRGSGNVTVIGGRASSSGADSPGIYSTGNITITGARITAHGPEAAVIEGSNLITLKNTSLTGGNAQTGGVMIYQSFSGDAETGVGVFAMDGGSLTVLEGPVFFVTNTDGIISLSHVQVRSGSGVLVNATGTSRWGSSGKNGGSVQLHADGEMLNGSLITDSISSVTASLENHSILTGAIRTASLSLDNTSSWNVTAHSALAVLTDSSGITNGSVSNIIGNGYTVTYNASLSGNAALEGKTYSLMNGGSLIPK